jgi:hypothetical protein
MNNQLFTCFIAGLLAACTAPDPPPQQTSRVPQPHPRIYKNSRPKLTELEAIGLARRAATRNGIDLRQFATPSARYHHTNEHDAWFVHFPGKAALPGNHFAVQVEDKTGQTRIRPGA